MQSFCFLLASQTCRSVNASKLAFTGVLLFVYSKEKFSNLEMYSSMNYHTFMLFLFPQRVPSDLEVSYEKSKLSRTETFSITICFKEHLLSITVFLRRTCFYLLFILIRTWNLVLISFFLFRDPQKLCLRQLQLRNQRAITPRNSLLAFYPQNANPCKEAF